MPDLPIACILTHDGMTARTALIEALQSSVEALADTWSELPRGPPGWANGRRPLEHTVLSGASGASDVRERTEG
jgi:hypothetical protein